MNRKEKIEYYQKAKSKNAEPVEAPFLPAAKKENLESVVSLRFSGYELALLKKVCEKKKTTLSSLIRNTVISALEEETSHDSQKVNLFESFSFSAANKEIFKKHLKEDLNSKTYVMNSNFLARSN